MLTSMISIYVFILAFINLLYFSKAQEYVGCYRDNSSHRALPLEQTPGGSPQRCQKTCQDSTYSTYFGVQFSYQCYCGEAYDRYGSSDESDCSRKCIGYRNQTCGGINRNSVYYVCPRGKFGQNCGQDCHCSGEEFCFRNGTCQKNVDCEMGWEGSTCSMDIDECEEQPTPCNQGCMNTLGSFYCYCYNDSYRLDASENRMCNDIDECKEKPGVCAHNCLNIEGGYDCTCNQGYKSLNGGKTCVDIDECATNNGSCSHFCNNAIGSFSCQCPENLELRGDGKTCRDHGLAAWAIAVIIVGGVILFALVILAIVYLYRRNHWTSAKPNSATKVKMTKSFSSTGDPIAAISSNDLNNKNDAIGDVMDPLYENLAGLSGATRMKVSDPPEVVERIRENSQVLSKEFKHDYEQLNRIAEKCTNQNSTYTNLRLPGDAIRR